MAKYNIYRLITLLLTVISLSPLNAQTPEMQANDTVKAEQLFRRIEEASGFRIYSDAPVDLDVIAPDNTLPVEAALGRAFENTPYKVSVQGSMIFVLRDKELKAGLEILYVERERAGSAGDALLRQQEEESAVSENLIYTIGDPNARSVPGMVLLRGRVIYAGTDEPVPWATVAMGTTQTGAITGANGEFSLRLPSGRVQLDISGMNIRPTRRLLMLYGDGVFNIELAEQLHQIESVTVTARTDNRVPIIGVENIQLTKIKNIPMTLGEVDILRAIQTLPGVTTVGEVSTGFNVRGGATDQNLILLNEGTIYNPNHLFGFFTAFNFDMGERAELYKSTIPAQYGGRISSVLEITGKEASKEEFKGSAGLGLVSSKLNLELPVVRSKSSLLLSGRTTYSDWILRELPETSGFRNGSAGFYDMGMVLSNDLNEKNQLNVYGYASRDRFSFTQDDAYEYQNINASVRWRKTFNERFFSRFGAGYDHYDYDNMDKTDPLTAHNISFGIDQVFAKADLSLVLDKHRLDFGFKSILYNINGGTYGPEGAESMVKYDKLQEERALESAFYIGDQWDITPDFSINAGIRYSLFNALGPRTYHRYGSALPDESTVIDTVSVGANKPFHTYHGPEYRLAAQYAVSNNLSFKIGFNSMRQYIHRLSNTVIMSPMDTWKLSDSNIKPQRGWQAASGLYYNPSHNKWGASVEVYYKKMKDYLDYRSGARLLMNHQIETAVINTQGRAYGVELAFNKTAGRLNGWINYTYSRTFLRQDNEMFEYPVNNGNWYPADSDKPHDFKLAGNYKFTQRYSLSLNIDYSTGRPVTIPMGKYFDHSLNSVLVYYGDRNSYRIPDYFRMDFSFNIEPSHRLRLLTYSSISFGIYNLTGRKNIYSVYFVSEGNAVKGYQMSIFAQPIPFVTYNIKF